ncbi:methyltransferase domain-containing protein, partial [bacterium]
MLARYRYSEPKKNHIFMTDLSMKRRDEFDSSRAGLIKLTCLICGGDSFKQIGQVDRYGFYYPTGICKHCGNVQQMEYYDNDTLDDFYANYYRDIYSDQSPQDLFEEQLTRGSSILSFVTHFIPKSGHILEIGTGAGGILKVFIEAGAYEVNGLDFDERYIEYGRSQGIEITRGGLENVGDGKKFDLIIISHVLEHIVDPSAFLKATRKLLKENGKIYIEVPSLNHVFSG